MDRARCVEHPPDLFHPERGESPTPAKKVCMECEVRIPCGRYALADPGLDGVWGALSQRDRQRLRRQRRQKREAS
jgi:WhiB family redox-sensing transcriptional regulator